MDRPEVATSNDRLGDRVFATLSRPARRKRERRRPAEFPAAEVGIEFKTGGIGYRLRT